MNDVESGAPTDPEDDQEKERNKIVHTGTIGIALGLAGLFGIGSCIGIYFGLKTIRMIREARYPVEGVHRWMGHIAIVSGILSFAYLVAFLLGFRIADFLASAGISV